MEQRDLLNYVANQPEVISALAPDYLSVDLSPFFRQPRNIMIGTEKGVVLFGWLGDDVYEMHYLLTHELRGCSALLFVKSSLRTMFTSRFASAICGITPRENRAARAMNRALGARPIGVSTDSIGRACINYVLERATWAKLSAES